MRLGGAGVNGRADSSRHASEVRQPKGYDLTARRLGLCARAARVSTGLKRILQEVAQAAHRLRLLDPEPSRTRGAAATPLSDTSASSTVARSSEASGVYRMPRTGTHRGLSLDGNGHASPRAPYASGDDPWAESATHPRQGSLGLPATDCLPEMSVGQTVLFLLTHFHVLTFLGGRSAGAIAWHSQRAPTNMCCR